jgi:hypothetical protein
VRNDARLPKLWNLSLHYEAHRVAQAIRRVNVEPLDSDAPCKCEDWGGRLVSLW